MSEGRGQAWDISLAIAEKGLEKLKGDDNRPFVNVLHHAVLPWVEHALRMRHLFKYYESSDMWHSAYACGKEGGCVCGMEIARDRKDEIIEAFDELVKKYG